MRHSKDRSFILLDIPYEGNALPGQFFTLKTPAGPYIPRPFSVYNLKDGIISFLIKSGGDFEKYLTISSEIIMNGPFGNPIPYLGDPMLIAGGSGYAPIHFYASRYEFTEMIVGATDESFFDLIDVPARSVCVVDPMTPLDVAKFSPARDILVCGPHEMLKNAKRIFEGTDLYFIMEEKMACARGMCEGCAVMTNMGIKFICKDGTTFKASEVDLEWTYR